MPPGSSEASFVLATSIVPVVNSSLFALNVRRKGRVWAERAFSAWFQQTMLTANSFRCCLSSFSVEISATYSADRLSVNGANYQGPLESRDAFLFCIKKPGHSHVNGSGDFNVISAAIGVSLRYGNGVNSCFAKINLLHLQWSWW